MKLIKSSVLVFLLCFHLVSCTSVDSEESNYEKLSDGIVLKLSPTKEGDAQCLKVKVISDEIIQVASTPEKEMPEDKSLIIVNKETSKDWELVEEENNLIISTSKLRVKIDPKTGAVAFFDKEGNEIVSEVSGVTSEEDDYKFVKYFSTDDSEAFYGLGQHQEGVMNYKGYQVDLTQYNSTAVVPFVVSSKEYGLLWDNYSITKFGDVRPYKELSDLTLYNKDGEKDNLTATYGFLDDSKKPFLVRNENKIAYEFLESMEPLPENYDMSKAKIVWEGAIESDKTGKHTFLMPGAGYVKVWINGELLLDKWREAWNPGPALFTYSLQSGQKQSIKIEWIPDGGVSYLALRYLPPVEEQMKDKFAFASEGGDLTSYYFVHGNNLDEVISGYRKLTGSAQVMPKWALGFWQSRERYKTQEEVLNAVKEFRKRNIPLDNIVLDWSYWEEDQWGSQKFDATRFPDPNGMIKEIHEKYNAHFMISVWPKFYEGIDNYKFLDEKGLLYKKSIEDSVKDWIGQGYVSTFYDAYNPEGRKAFWELLSKNLFSKGVDAWWLDATEPDILSNATIEYRKELMNPNHLGSATDYFNAYSLMNAKGIYEGQREENPNQRVFILTRSAFAGLQHYGAATWSGDIASTFGEMERQIPGGLNFGLSGLPYWTTDIGGFFVENKYDRPAPQGEALNEWRELNARWYQFGTFTPLYRAHGQFPYREVYNIAPESHPAYKSIVYYNKLRYRLMPYIYSLAGKVHFDDYTIMRALVMDFNDDKEVYDIANQFMFGPSLLINPVTEYKATSRELYLPKSNGWYDLYSGKFYEGGQTMEADAPYERMPIFVKAGAILPFGPEIEYTTEKPADPITLYVYKGANGSFELYEDENINYNYEQGRFSKISFSYENATNTLTIGTRNGSFDGMLQERTFHIIAIDKSNAKELNFDQQPQQTIQYTGAEVKVKI
ncbi:TIM-barrel domain-containing protein [Fulvivirga sediminis]|uniref:DUF5110 domain-containing protein n=1 Tax=Fulvivirga sediminis TaxID=2803949 RepID=A0A937F7P1_9BACT|nr:TIM-barrel domain-containing protein [Fulvivirga sediminis]MBL3655603.1 DUF5110 domain-containing protein [Fulvivirga sediminis]